MDETIEYEDESLSIEDLLVRIAGVRQRPSLTFVGEIRRGRLFELRDRLNAIQGRAVDLVIQSEGGDIEAAYLTARTIARRFEDIRVIVPLQAKSAATLLALVGREIVFGEFGELGPLDGQAFDGTSSLVAPIHDEESVRLAADALDAVLPRVARHGSVFFDSSRLAAEVVGRTLSAARKPLEPCRTVSAILSLRESEALLRRAIDRNRPQDARIENRDLARKLVRGYPCHGFPIDFHEALDLGIPSRPALPAEAFYLEPLAELFAAGDDSPMIIATEPPEAIEEEEAVEPAEAAAMNGEAIRAD